MYVCMCIHTIIPFSTMYFKFSFQIYSQISCVEGVHFLTVEVQSWDCYHRRVIVISIFWRKMSCGFSYFQYLGVKCHAVSHVVNILEWNAMRVLVFSFPWVWVTFKYYCLKRQFEMLHYVYEVFICQHSPKYFFTS